jgi:endonuclease YncB( thermonuclease family)
MHDFEKFPELTNAQLQFYYFDSPHKQIFENFQAIVRKVHDGDTITVSCDFRDFEFPVRFANIAAPELSEGAQGKDAQSWLEDKILGEEITIKITKLNRVDKWGRLLGNIIFRGMDIGVEEIMMGKAKSWEGRNEGKIINPIKKMAEFKWA